MRKSRVTIARLCKAARANAITETHRQAETIAQTLGVRVGCPVAVMASAQPPVRSQTGAPNLMKPSE
ncbi:MAG: hypothetical protein ACXWNK_18090 [Vulcanimicrobiaceae bacterium]